VPRPTWAEVNLGALRANLAALRTILAPGVKVLGVVKADGYGHGMARVARTLEESGIEMLGVALVEEGVALRSAGIRVPILLMGTLPADEIANLVAHDLAATVDDAATAEAVDREARRAGKTVPVHLKVDTGMNRLGVRAEEAVGVAEAVAGLRNVRLDGVYTHFACAEMPDRTATEDPLRRFGEVLRALGERNLKPPMVHAANSAAIVAGPESHFDMVRPGLSLYGILPVATATRLWRGEGAPKTLRLKPALALRSRVAHLKRVRRGEGVSYGHTWRAERDSVVGLLPIGYGDGYPRALSNKGQVRIGEGEAARLAPVVGTICMDATLVDLTDVPQPRTGLAATLIEADVESPLNASALARRSGTIPYEILTGIGARVPRVYV
jgi:alanine racemase